MNITYFVQFYNQETTKWNNETKSFEIVKPYFSEAIGSDSVFILDGRNNIETMKSDSIGRILKLSTVQNYKAFQIRKGTFSDSKLLYSSF